MKAMSILKRPEFTSVLGAVLIFTLFMIVAPSFRSLDAFSTAVSYTHL